MQCGDGEPYDLARWIGPLYLALKLVGLTARLEIVRRFFPDPVVRIESVGSHLGDAISP